jgi:hypothetical protein
MNAHVPELSGLGPKGGVQRRIPPLPGVSGGVPLKILLE